VTAQTPTTEPTILIAGDTAKWLKTLADYPATEGWVLTYTLISAASKISIVATPDGDQYLVNVAPSVTTAWAAGDYDYRAQVTKDTDAYTVASGRMTVQPSFGAATLDNRSQARKILEAIESRILGTATSGVLEYEIAGRRLKHYSVGELLALRDKFRAEVRNEDAATNMANGLGLKNRTYVRFGS
jgi:hypothetical protein